MTLAELRTRILQNLTVLASGQTPSDEDATLIEDIVTSEHGTLQADSLAPWELTAIPPFLEQPLVKYMSFHCAKSFGKAPDPIELQLGLRDIRKFAAEKAACDDVVKVSDF